MTINAKTSLAHIKNKTSQDTTGNRGYTDNTKLSAGWKGDSNSRETGYFALKLDYPTRATFSENIEEGTGVMVWSQS